MSKVILDMRLEHALELATRGHRNQTRRGTLTPYVAHPFHVAMILQRMDAPEDVVLAALLHDTLEDTSVTRAEIVARVGERVAALVEGVTAEHSDDRRGRSWRQVKEEALARLHTADVDVVLLKCADTFHNASTLEAAGPDALARLKRPPEEMLWYYSEVANVCCERLGVHHPLAAGLHTVMARLKRTLQ